MTIKEKVQKALPICGTHINLVDPIVTEIFGALGYYPFDPCGGEYLPVESPFRKCAIRK